MDYSQPDFNQFKPGRQKLAAVWRRIRVPKAPTSLVISLLALAVLAANDAGMLMWFKTQSASSALAYQQQVAGLQGSVAAVGSQQAQTQADLSTVKAAASKPAIIEQVSSPQSVTASVAKAVPAVVSVIISKDVPQYTVEYQNPFGNDPAFQGFGVQIPVYVPTGKTKSQEVGAGTGFIITSNGYILTNKHVVSDTSANYTVLLSNGKQQTATVVYRDPTNDIAVIKIQGSGYPTVRLGDSASLQLGQTVIAIGNALGQYNNSVSEGIISGLNRTIQASDAATGSTETLRGVIQTDAAINPGNSGGPLIDLSGNVVGINVATASGANSIGFSIPIGTVRQVLANVPGITL